MAKTLKFEIDVVNLFNSTTSSAALKRAAASTLSDASFRREFGRRLVDRITQRTQSGIDMKGSPLAAYKKSYVKSLEFEIYGKKEGEVNLTLTGEMLASMDVKDTPPRKVVIGFQSDLQNDKAHGHVYGGGYKRSLPVRNFFGLPLGAQKEILLDTMRDFNAPVTVFDLPDTEPTPSDGGTGFNF